MCAWLLPLALLASGCSVWLSDRAVERAHTAALPADVAATLLAAALRDEWRSEPVARAAGAPATRHADGSYVVELEGDARGRWLPVARHRLRVVAAPAAAVVERALAAPLTGFGHRAVTRVRVRIAPRERGCEVRLRCDDGDLRRLDEVVQRTLALAATTTAGGPGRAEPNQVAWRLACLLRAADATAEPSRREALLRRAARLPGAPVGVLRLLGERMADDGHHDRAIAELRRAALCEPDPRRRAAILSTAAAVRHHAEEPGSVRNTALGRLFVDDVRTAEHLLHSARRATPAPAIDYHLLGQLHRHRGDEMAALAAELLAREYDAAGRPGASVAGAGAEAPIERVWTRRMRAWSRRLDLSAQPLRASAAASPPR